MEDKIAMLFAAVEHLAEKAGEKQTVQWLGTVHGPAFASEIAKQKRDHLGGFVDRLSPVVAKPSPDTPSQFIIDIRKEHQALLEQKALLELNKLRAEVEALKAAAAGAAPPATAGTQAAPEGTKA